MAYDLEKYSDKREKVLGVKKRGISFGTMSAIISLIIIIGLGVAVVPKSIAYFNTRHLDDAIYKLQNAETWTPDAITAIQELVGVKSVETDNNDTRIVITFDKSITGTHDINAFFKQNNIQTVLLNEVSHSNRLKVIEKESKF